MNSRGLRIIGTAPWPAVIGTSGVAFGLLGFALAAHGDATEMLTVVVLGVGMCGASAAHGLDEFCVPIADASPTSRGPRMAWRATIVLAPTAVIVSGLVALSLAHPGGHWQRQFPFAFAIVACGLSVAALLRRHEMGTPGHAAGGITLLGTLVFVGIDPFHRWAPALPHDQHVAHTAVLWIAVGVAAVLITILSTHDPGRPRPGQRRRA